MREEGFLLSLPSGVMPTPTMRATLGPRILAYDKKLMTFLKHSFNAFLTNTVLVVAAV